MNPSIRLLLQAASRAVTLGLRALGAFGLALLALVLLVTAFLGLVSAPFRWPHRG